MQIFLKKMSRHASIINPRASQDLFLCLQQKPLVPPMNQTIVVDSPLFPAAPHTELYSSFSFPNIAFRN